MPEELEIVRGGERQRITVGESDMIRFPEGLVGCGSWKRFVLLQDDDDRLISVLYCLDEPELAFLVTDPWLVEPKFQLQLSDDDVAALGTASEEQLVVLSMLVADHERAMITANLLGPLVINPSARIGRQVVLAESGYSARHAVAPMRVSDAEAGAC